MRYILYSGDLSRYPFIDVTRATQIAIDKGATDIREVYTRKRKVQTKTITFECDKNKIKLIENAYGFTCFAVIHYR